MTLGFHIYMGNNGGKTVQQTVNDRQNHAFEGYVNKYGRFHIGPITVYGKLDVYESENNVLKFCPSIVGIEEDFLRIDMDEPTIVSPEKGDTMAARPLSGGINDLVRIVIDHNRNTRSSDGPRLILPPSYD